MTANEWRIGFVLWNSCWLVAGEIGFVLRFLQGSGGAARFVGGPVNLELGLFFHSCRSRECSAWAKADRSGPILREPDCDWVCFAFFWQVAVCGSLLFSPPCFVDPVIQLWRALYQKRGQKSKDKGWSRDSILARSTRRVILQPSI